MENAPASTNRLSRRWLLPLLLALLAVIASYFVGLSALPLFDEDEPRFAEAARVMMETGDYITPTFNGYVRFAKPVFIYWLMIGSYRLFGVSELAARFPSALASALTAVVIVWLVSRMAPGRVPWLAALAWGSFLQTGVWAKAATTDATLTLFLTTSYLALYLAFRTPQPHKRAWYLLAGAAMGLAFLTKGPIGVVLPLAVGALYLLSVGRLKDELRQARVWEPLLVCLAIAAPWYYMAYREHGMVFLKTFFVTEHIGRYAGREQWEFQRLFYFVPFVLFMTFPFSALLPAMVKAGWRRSAPTAEQDGHDFRRYLLCWFLLVVVLFSLSGVKNPQYVMSVYPALAIFGALYFEGLLRDRPGLRRYEKVAILLALLMAAVLAAAAASLPRLLPLYAARLHANPSPRVPLIAAIVTAVAVLGTLLAACSWALRRRGLALGAMIGMSWLLGLMALFLLGPEIASYRQAPMRTLCRTAQMLVPTDSVVVLYGFRSSAVVFYSHRRVGSVPLDRPHGLARAMGHDERIGIIAPQDETRRLTALRPLSDWDRQGAYVLLGRNPQHRRGARPGAGP